MRKNKAKSSKKGLPSSPSTATSKLPEDALYSDIPNVKMSPREKASWIISQFNRMSQGAVVFLIFMYSIVGYYWHSMIGSSMDDLLLVGIWAFMSTVLIWNINAKRDLSRAVVGLLGGLIIEAWGTQTSIWTYYTFERPPLWIIPAWPVATIAIDRIARIIDLMASQVKLEKLWWVMVIGFPILMADFVWDYIHYWTTMGAFFLVFATFVIPGDRRQDMTLMVAGGVLGVFLEYWGNSRHCWTYYNGEIAPVFAIFAHGFAAIAFQRGAFLLLVSLRKIGDSLKAKTNAA